VFTDIMKVFNDEDIYTPYELSTFRASKAKSWPTVDELRGKVILSAHKKIQAMAKSSSENTKGLSFFCR